jgi:hypothetical protein
MPDRREESPRPTDRLRARPPCTAASTCASRPCGRALTCAARGSAGAGLLRGCGVRLCVPRSRCPCARFFQTPRACRQVIRLCNRAHRILPERQAQPASALPDAAVACAEHAARVAPHSMRLLVTTGNPGIGGPAWAARAAPCSAASLPGVCRLQQPADTCCARRCTRVTKHPSWEPAGLPTERDGLDDGRSPCTSLATGTGSDVWQPCEALSGSVKRTTGVTPASPPPGRAQPAHSLCAHRSPAPAAHHVA